MKSPQNLIYFVLSYWISRQSLSAWILSLIVIICTVIIVILNLCLNNWQSGFYSELQQYNRDGFYNAMLQFTLISVIYILTSGYQSYYRLILELNWRQWLTDKYVSTWLHNHIYYHLNLLNSAIDNPAQRISEDVSLFIHTTLDLLVGLLRHSITLIAFSVVLWNLSGSIMLPVLNVAVPGYLVWLALLYSIAGTWLTVQTGLPLINCNVLQQTTEAEYRACLDRLKESDECVALYSGEEKEKLTIAAYFQRLARNYREIAKVTKKITLLSVTYSQLSIVFAFLVASPRYFNNEIQLGQLFEISGAYWYVHSALSFIIDSFGKLAFWKALMVRLNNFNVTMAEIQLEAEPRGTIVFSRNNQLEIKNLTILSMFGQVLLKNITLNLQGKDRLLISGPTGCGKTTLFRTLAGIWPNFTGHIAKPKQQNLLFLPQKPYMFVSTLRDLLLYPRGSHSISDKTLSDILTQYKLEFLSGKLDTCADWGKTLSLGQQQCLSIARAILHQPDWLFLDEATSSMDMHTEQQIYAMLHQQLPDAAIISIGHRETLRQYHTRNLVLDSSSTWYITPLKEKPHQQPSLLSTL